MNFVPCSTMGKWTLDFIKLIPNQFDLIVGIPIGGLPFASLLAGKFGRPMTTSNCDQIKYARFSNKAEVFKSILVCDDTMSQGNTMASSVKEIKQRFPDAKIRVAVVIVQPDAIDKVDYWFKKMKHPRMFEWNIAYGKWGNLACDIDGVICQDLPVGLDEYSLPDAYKRHIINVPASFIPQYTIDTIVSCRLEKYRSITEEWLVQHGVKYGQLLLWNVSGPMMRAGKHVDYKVNQIKNSNATYMFESNWEQTVGIHKALKLPVLCFDRMVMLGGENG